MNLKTKYHIFMLAVISFLGVGLLFFVIVGTKILNQYFLILGDLK